MMEAILMSLSPVARFDDASVSSASVPTTAAAADTRFITPVSGTEGAPGLRRTFTNPIAPGADPCVVWHDGLYYWCASENDGAVVLCQSERLTEPGEKRVVWTAPASGPHCGEIWAPELHRLDGKWYIYVAASNGSNANHRMIVLEGEGGGVEAFHFKAELYTGDDIVTSTENRWAIDGTILEHDGRRYFLWSGWEDDRDEQWLYLAAMENPWTIGTARVRLCANDDFLWERVDETVASRGLNEAPQVLTREGRVFVVYSASASWKTNYKLGLLELVSGGDPLDPSCWRKREKPVFQSTRETWGVGHCGFTRSPDGAEDWIVYHAKLERTPNWKRAVHVQRFGWDESGAPIFGEPVAAGVPLALPSGECGATGGPDGAEVALGRAALAALVGESPLVETVRVVGHAG
jgi:GH43 family beta-xylosidase